MTPDITHPYVIEIHTGPPLYDAIKALQDEEVSHAFVKPDQTETDPDIDCYLEISSYRLSQTGAWIGLRFRTRDEALLFKLKYGGL